MDNTVAHLNEKQPDWPALMASEEIGSACRALAMQIASVAAQFVLRLFLTF